MTAILSPCGPPAMKVRISDTRPGAGERFVMEDGRVFWINRHGWIFDASKKSVPHPLVDEVMQAVVDYEDGRR